MRKKLRKIIVTGGAGFIGSAFVRLLAGLDRSCIVIDKLTYAGDVSRIREAKGKYRLYKTDICDKTGIDCVFRKEKPEIIFHFAAESHVDRSICDAAPFMKTNIKGTQVLMDISRKYRVKKFVFISTDEVYGDIKKGSFKEGSPLRPSSPYAASKAAADLLVQSYIRTYDFPAIIIRPSNNYGPWQCPEKLIPLAILKIMRGEKVPVYAKGMNIREWLYVDDCARGILGIIIKGKTGQIYNLGSGREKRNIEVVRMLIKIFKADKEMIKFVADRPGHDIRYSLDSLKVRKAAGWSPVVTFEEGLQMTALWSILHKRWLLKESHC